VTRIPNSVVMQEFRCRYWPSVCVGGMLVLACDTSMSSGRVESVADTSPMGCISDTECPDGFCDRNGICESVFLPRRFGMACQWSPTLPSGAVDGRYFAGCAAYRCTDGRCRSCASDVECGDGLMCRAVPELYPGYACGRYDGLTGARAPDFQPRVDPTLFGVRVERTYPHSRDASTEGLVYQNGWLYESTGVEGASSVRRVELETGRIDQVVALGPEDFGEGLAAFAESLLQLTYQTGRLFVWNRDSLSVERELSYEGEGWGLCYDGRRLVMSDGSNVLQFRDPATFEQLGTLQINLDRFLVARLNELECVADIIYANLLEQRQIVRIDATSGAVTGWIDTGNLLGEGMGDSTGAGALNGIAYVPERDRLLLTGKNWPWVFEVSIVPLAGSPAESSRP
jgi:glutaminyl-peptide cyclotransferase